jgi:hypothetical protein
LRISSERAAALRPGSEEPFGTSGAAKVKNADADMLGWVCKKDEVFVFVCHCTSKQGHEAGGRKTCFAF